MKINHVKCYKKDYPRPQFVRESWLNLNGEWDFVFDDKNIGEVEGYFREFPRESLKIQIFTGKKYRSFSRREGKNPDKSCSGVEFA